MGGREWGGGGDAGSCRRFRCCLRVDEEKHRQPDSGAEKVGLFCGKGRMTPDLMHFHKPNKH